MKSEQHPTHTPDGRPNRISKALCDQRSRATARRIDPVSSKGLERSRTGKRNTTPAATVLLRPSEIRPSKWMNRDPLALKDQSFVKLREQILADGINQIPIKVRPLPARTKKDRHKRQGARYEIVYGHRRHQACSDLDIMVLAMVEEVSDIQLVAEMLAENDQRRDLSPLEQGRMFARLIKDIFKKQCRLAEALGRDPGDVSRVLTLTRLPQVVLEAMVCPLELTIHDADRLGPLLKNDPAGLRSAAKRLLKLRGPLAAREVVRALSDGSGKKARQGSTAKTISLTLNGVVYGEMQFMAGAGLTVSIRAALSEEQRADLLARLQTFLLDNFGARLPVPPANTARRQGDRARKTQGAASSLASEVGR